MKETELVGVEAIQDMIELCLFTNSVKSERIVSVIIIGEPESAKTELMKKYRKNAGDPILKWKLADVIVNFLDDVESNQFIIINYSDAFSRDLDLSKRLIESMINFRKTYSSIEMINPNINWDRYRELLDIPDIKIRQLLKEKILDGSIKSRDDIKQFKKIHLKSFRTRKSCRARIDP